MIRLSQCQVLARLRHAAGPEECLLIGKDRKSPRFGQIDANDPERTSAGGYAIA